MIISIEFQIIKKIGRKKCRPRMNKIERTMNAETIRNELKNIIDYAFVYMTQGFQDTSNYLLAPMCHLRA